MIRPVSSSDVKIKKPNITRKQSYKFGSNRINTNEKQPCQNSANAYKNGFLTIPNISFKGNDVKTGQDKEKNISIDINELLERIHGDIMVKVSVDHGYRETTVPKFIACGHFEDYPLYYDKQKKEELITRWQAEVSSAAKDQNSIYNTLQNEDSLVRYKDIADYLITNNRFEDVLEMARNNNKLYSECSQSVQEMIKSEQTDSALAKYPNQKKEILKECICQNKYEEALKIRSEYQDELINKDYDYIIDIKLIDYLLSSGRDDEALEIFKKEQIFIILFYLMQDRKEEALDTFDTMQELKNQSCIDISSGIDEMKKYIIYNGENRPAYDILRDKYDKYDERYLKKSLGKYLISQGRDDEAAARFSVGKEIMRPENYYYRHLEKEIKSAREAENLREIFKTISYWNSGLEYLPVALICASDENKDYAADFIENKADIANYEQREKQEAVDKAEGFLERDYSTPERAAIDILTLGIAELVNKNSREHDKEERLQKVDEDVRSKKEAINASKAMLLDCRDSNIGSKQVKSSDMHSLEEQKEEVKKPLQSRYIAPLNALKYGTPAKLPNCVMLTGDTPDVMKKIIDWTGVQAENTNTNYVKLPSIPNKDEMYNNLLDTLEQAEENYQNSGNRSLIFVNGMDKLLREDSNTQSEIASMKDIMSDTNKNFHSTIIFYTTNPDKLDPATVMPHRVGLKVNVPFDKFKIDEGE